MDRDGARSRRDSTHADRDGDHDFRTDSDRHASDPDPQPDPVGHHGHHHQYRYLYFNPNFHRNQHIDTDSIPACDRDIYSYIHAVHDAYSNLYFHAIFHEYIYSHCFIDQHTNSLYYIFPNHPIT